MFSWQARYLVCKLNALFANQIIPNTIKETDCIVSLDSLIVFEPEPGQK